jgi:hypothetical protein
MWRIAANTVFKSMAGDKARPFKLEVGEAKNSQPKI